MVEKANARSESSRTSRASLEVFGGAPRLLQAGIFDEPTPPNEQNEEPPAISDSYSLFESMMEASMKSTDPAMDMKNVSPFPTPLRTTRVTSPALPQSSVNLAQVERSLSDRALIFDAPRSSSSRMSSARISSVRSFRCNSNRGMDDVDVLKSAKSTRMRNLSEGMLADHRGVEWESVMRSSHEQAQTLNKSTNRTIAGGSSKELSNPSTSHRRYSLEEGKAEYVYSGYRASSRKVNGKSLEGSVDGRVRISADLQRALSSFQQTFVVSDATQPDYPIMFASACFLSMTGYSENEIIGQNCRFLQGPQTDRTSVAKIRDALKQGRNFCGRLLNYKKDGSTFWNLLNLTPIRGDHGRVIMYIGMQVEVSKFTEGSREKALRPNGLSASLIRYDSRQIDQATDSVTEIVGAFRKSSHSVPRSPEYLTEDDEADVSGMHSDRKQLHAYLHSKEPHPVKKLYAADGSSDIPNGRPRRLSGFLMSFLGIGTKSHGVPEDHINLKDLVTTSSAEDDENRASLIRNAIDLATSLERINKNFVITDPRLPDNPIIFASDEFLDLTEYSREEVLGRNCRFLQGPETNPETVKQIRDSVADGKDITVQLLNYTKSGKPFWNLFHLQTVRDHQGELQYFIGLQLNGRDYSEAPLQRLSDDTERERAKLVQKTAMEIDDAVRELPDANLGPESLWDLHSRPVFPKPHMQQSPAWREILTARSTSGRLMLKNFKPLKPLGYGDTGSVHLVELRGTGQVFAMKAMDKGVLMNRNKVHRACAERQILELLDHPFLPTLYGSFQTVTHVCLIMNFCPGSELYLALEQQPKKHFREESARFYAAEIIIALEYLHCLGVVYRDLKPENILIQDNGHIQLTDFDLSINSSANLQLMETTEPKTKRKMTKINVTPKLRRRSKASKHPVFFAEPLASSNSFVGTEEYISPEIITGHGHSSAVDWWSLGILLYEMLFGRTPFKGGNRQKTFANVLAKDLSFPSNIPVSSEARQLIQGLLAKEPIKRLGSTHGAHDIKSHPFFRGIKWPLIRCMSPPELEVPVHFIASLEDLVKESADFEWDDVEATSPFRGVF